MKYLCRDYHKYFLRLNKKAELESWLKARASYIMLPATLCITKYMWFTFYSFKNVILFNSLIFYYSHVPVVAHVLELQKPW
jgi:hypothetical protein